VVLLVDLTVLIERGHRLQYAQVAIGEAVYERGIERLGQRPPGRRQHVLVGELFVQDDRVQPFIHGRYLLSRSSSIMLSTAAASGASDTPCATAPCECPCCGRLAVKRVMTSAGAILATAASDS